MRSIRDGLRFVLPFLESADRSRLLSEITVEVDMLDFSKQRFQLVPVNGATRVRVAFLKKASYVDEVRLALGDQQQATCKCSSREFEGHWSKPIQESTAVDAFVRFTGENVGFAAIAWWNGTWVTQAGTNALLADALRAEMLATESIDAALLIEGQKRIKARRGNNKALDRYRDFFHALDNATGASAHKNAPDPGKTLLTKLSLIANLTETSLARATTTAQQLSEDNRSSVRQYHDIVMRLIGKHFPIANYVDDIWNAFELFSTGELYLGAPLNGEPDSANYFLFAELALAALDLFKDLRWEPLLAPWIATQETYVAAYGPPSVPQPARRWRDYDVLQNGAHRGVNLVPGPVRVEIRARYRKMNTAEIRAQLEKNVRTAFPMGY